MSRREPPSLEDADQPPAFVNGFSCQRNSDGSDIVLYVYDVEGNFHRVDRVTETTVCLLQNALADPRQAVEFYIVNDKVGLMFRRFRS